MLFVWVHLYFACLHRCLEVSQNNRLQMLLSGRKRPPSATCILQMRGGWFQNGNKMSISGILDLPLLATVFFFFFTSAGKKCCLLFRVQEVIGIQHTWHTPREEQESSWLLFVYMYTCTDAAASFLHVLSFARLRL